jgi:hypothetical protein
MLPDIRKHPSFKLLLLCSVITIALTVVPAQPTAAGGASLPLTNSLDQFAGGQFFRSALDADDIDGTSSVDLPGSVKLTPTGSLRTWSRVALNSGLPTLTDAPMVALGNRVYILGGRGGDSGGIFSDKLYWSEINPDTGAPTNPVDPAGDVLWVSQDLPATRHSDAIEGPNGRTLNCTEDKAARGNLAAAAYSPNNSNTGVLYMVGGAVECTAQGSAPITSSYAFQYGTVAFDGTITWQTGPQLPIPEILSDGDPPTNGADTDLYEGIQDAVAVVAEVANRRFLYLVGGLRVDTVLDSETGLSTKALGSKKTYYIELDANGAPLPDTDWQTTADLPLPSQADLGVTFPTQIGLWKAGGTLVEFDVGGGGVESNRAMFITGGQQVYDAQTPEGTYNVRMFRGLINADGSVNWTSTPGNSSNVDVSLPERRYGLISLSSGGKLYQIGGIVPNNVADATTLPSGTRKSTVLTLPVEDNLTITVGQGTPYNGVDADNILGNGELLEPAGAVTVPATPTPEAPNATWVLVFGGRSGETGDASNILIRGQLGGQNETISTGFTSSGWYYSAPRPILFEGGEITADVQKIVWNAQIDRGAASNMDIQIQFRVGTPPPGPGACQQPDVFADDVYDPETDTGPRNGWRNLPALEGEFFSRDGSASANKLSNNIVDLIPRPTASCFQYRALMSTSGNVTPVLLNVSLTVVLPGRPDIKIMRDNGGNELFTAFYGENGKLAGFNLYLTNENLFEPPTQPADFAEQVLGNRGGSFFVDMCIFRPGEQVTTPVNPYDGSLGCTDVYTLVDKTDMEPGAQMYQSNSYWFAFRDVILPQDDDSTVSYTQDQQVNILDYFRELGTYQVYVVIDPLQPIGLRCEVDQACVDEGTEGGEANNLSGMLQIEVQPLQTGQEINVEDVPVDIPVDPTPGEGEPLIINGGNDPGSLYLPLIFSS